jgi:hypothetical protein
LGREQSVVVCGLWFYFTANPEMYEKFSSFTHTHTKHSRHKQQMAAVKKSLHPPEKKSHPIFVTLKLRLRTSELLERDIVGIFYAPAAAAVQHNLIKKKLISRISDFWN